MRQASCGRINCNLPSQIWSSTSTIRTIRSPAGSTTRSKSRPPNGAPDFWRYRVPKFLGYFERVLQHNGGTYMVGRRLSYVDLSIFEIVEGLRYAFPKRMKRFEKKVPGLIALRDRVAKRPRIKAYLASKRRIPFSQWGIYRYFKELDA